MENEIIRLAARVIVIDELGRVLLFRIPPPQRRPNVSLWLTPGGGIEPGEEAAEAAARELWEETGLRGTTIGPEIWQRSFPYEAGGLKMRQVERYFVARVASFEPTRENFEAHEHAFITDHRWWSMEEICASGDYFIPRALGTLLAPILRGEFPDMPFDCGT